jgi:ribonuclease T2
MVRRDPITMPDRWSLSEMMRLLHMTSRCLAALVCMVPFLATPASAQRDYDSSRQGRDRFDWNRKQDPLQRNLPGQFDYYALVLSWSPTHCSGAAGQDDDLQCNRSDGRRYAFVVHGLWPQYTKGYPQNCVPRGTSYVPQQLIDSMLDIMPSKKLIIHEYRKHGTCSGLAPFAYFDMIRKQFAEITVPDRFINPYESQFVSPEDLVDELIDENPQLKPEMIAVSCGGPGKRLKEIRICHSKDGKPTACGVNENQDKLCSASKMFVPPVRSTKTGPDVTVTNQSPPTSARPSISNPLPGP